MGLRFTELYVLASTKLSNILFNHFATMLLGIFYKPFLFLINLLLCLIIHTSIKDAWLGFFRKNIFDLVDLETFKIANLCIWVFVTWLCSTNWTRWSDLIWYQVIVNNFLHISHKYMAIYFSHIITYLYSFSTSKSMYLTVTHLS